MAGKVEGDQGTLQCKRHGVIRVGVLRAPVQQRQLGTVVTPAQSAQLAKSVDGDEEAPYRGHRDLEPPFVEVLCEKRELVVGRVGHVWHRRRCLLEMKE